MPMSEEKSEKSEKKSNDPFEFFQKRPEREELAHELANKLIKKRSLEPGKKKLEQMKNMLTPKSYKSGIPSTPESLVRFGSRLNSINSSIKH